MNESLPAAVETVAQHHVPADSVSVISPDITMAILTWVTFFIVLAILYKFAWKPILAGLDAREEKIRRAIDDAQKAKDELEKIEQTRSARITQADEEAKAIVDRARHAASEAAKVIEHKAKEEAQILLKNATHEINTLAHKTQVTLKKDSVDLAVALAEKIIHENLDQHKQQKLVDQFLKEFNPGSHEKL